ncbi:MAG TPA: hypothetical protein VEY11_10450 [Pyrinomonadaceae bacterium]|nr:hypothetical protein [Pyrinomonadaceae bacterium]
MKFSDALFRSVLEVHEVVHRSIDAQAHPRLGGDKHFAILTIDHIRPLKGKKRRPRIYQHLLAQGCPRDSNYQVLCLKCNMLKATGAECAYVAEARALFGLAA